MRGCIWFLQRLCKIGSGFCRHQCKVESGLCQHHVRLALAQHLSPSSCCCCSTSSHNSRLLEEICGSARYLLCQHAVADFCACYPFNETFALQALFMALIAISAQYVCFVKGMTIAQQLCNVTMTSRHIMLMCRRPALHVSSKHRCRVCYNSCRGYSLCYCVARLQQKLS